MTRPPAPDQRFGPRLLAAMHARGPLCVGIDPHPYLLAQWGYSDDTDGLRRFTDTVLAAIGDRVAAVKPQSAFFERHGGMGVTVLESCIRQLRKAGTVVILDAKRGDIGSTAAAYADAYLSDRAPIAVDAMTASPYLGFGSLRPLLDVALSTGRGVFVLAATSNPEGACVQQARTPDGRSVAQLMVDEVAQVNGGVEPVGDIGVVVGVTATGSNVDLSSVNGPILVPGFGAQGGRVEDVATVFGDARRYVLASSSREILSRGPSPVALRDAVVHTLDDLRRVL